MSGASGLGFCSAAAEVITRLMPSPSTASAATGRCFTSQNNRDAPLSINNFFTWSALKVVSSGTAVLPAAMIPKYAATHRGWFAARIATRASRGTRVESQFATLSDIWVSSAKVTRSTVCWRWISRAMLSGNLRADSWNRW